MYKIELSGKNGKGKFVVVDKDDYEGLSQYKWFFQGGYAARKSLKRDGPRVVIWMHRIINGTPEGYLTDHINGDKMDNRRGNLRTCTPSQNRGNTRLNSSNKSGYRGVYWHKSDRKWHAQIKINGQTLHLGFFDNPEKASIAYREVAKKHYGGFLT